MADGFARSGLLTLSLRGDMGICLCCGVLLAFESLSEVCELLAVEGFSELRRLIKFILQKVLENTKIIICFQMFFFV